MFFTGLQRRIQLPDLLLQLSDFLLLLFQPLLGICPGCL
jgi:hypothetical protein